MFKYKNLKKILFLFQPETAHNLAEIALRVLQKITILNNYMTKRNFVDNDKLTQEIFGVKFLNPVGLAAGFDKNSTMVKAMPALGFGFTEIGTMTPRPQDGNPKPRMFRYPSKNSVQNAMGFNNEGAHTVWKNLNKVYPNVLPIGVNIGKNKTTPKEYALSDYKTLIKKFKNTADYLAINISSPNTPNLRDLQNEDFITSLFQMAKEITDKPILLKIAPDMNAQAAIQLCKTAVNAGAAGIIATNTTIDYNLIPGCKDFGGLSGEVLTEKSYELFKEIAKELYGKTVLISVGGISNAQEAYRRIKAGASLVQAYTGMIFEGPSMVKNINEGLIELMKKDGYNNISEAIGADLKN
ncbi:dihydroorotate dehydrogenase (quinone) [Malaciobacter molluscorum LMG 25693]|uniref:Dihydroorotate dehydrogenase (quinone) n=1 Tax=Malaciobacter molluscorum LMG 25693 TaxID=870501 RepID=A0A2G1DJR4_9BACT|nr:quinone-dependent dihydroorotate dehydrogenase [Malaciobacter molluscorum]AXX92814.1 dihydroorotate dehydrogenase 2 [Malaciobacter molluscorum LMG 25693]PHO18654.1 dihydroorotate dehydrogenase (quinone) [Malaciobacter molluscorum LMG 25693]RXJ96136.1 dihydroorotate dehydrogenase (quinone) [Malaciobacter molluscorum]